MKATHSGHCQVCGRLQAAGKRSSYHVVNYNRIAKHGYNVKWGFFNGTCSGSDEQPIEQSKEVAEMTIERCLEDAAACDATTADDITKVSIEIFRKSTWEHKGGYEDVYINAGELALINWLNPRYEERIWAERVERELSNIRHRARMYRSHVDFLRGLIKTRHNQPLIERN